ncbi:exopolysaccharide biosynthesis polyprenyl glycosylphosphotransferase [Actinokineospora sp. 24-640]
MTSLDTTEPLATLPGPRRHAAPAVAVSAVEDALARINGVSVLLTATDIAIGLAAVRLGGFPLLWSAVFVTTLLGVRAAARLYRRRLWLSWLAELPRSLGATAVAFGLITMTLLVAGADSVLAPAQRALLVFTVASETARLLVFAFGRWARRRLGRCERSIVVGAGSVGVCLVDAMLDHPEFGLRPLGFVDPTPHPQPASLPVGLIEDDLASAIKRLRVGIVVLAFSHAPDALVASAAVTAHRTGCTTMIVPRMHELYQDGPDIDRIRSFPLVRLRNTPTMRPSWRLKLVIDRVVALLALLALAPVIAVGALAVLLESGRPVFFRQLRVGMDGRTFHLYKLRSLRPGGVNDEQTCWSVAADPRVGRVGRFLRRTSLDELPQLWNIVRGDMSFVGPRPERPGFVREFSATHELYWARHRVPTGLTGLAQVHGLRGDTSIADRARYDNYYIANWSLWLDLRILLLTIGELVRGGRR